MSAKKVTFGIKSTPQAPAAASADQWVESRSAEAMKRLTLDIPASLHMRVVVQAVLLIASVMPCADLSDTPKPDGCTFSIQQYV